MKKILLCAALLLGAALGHTDTSTARMGIVKPTIGSTGWGVKWNDNANIIDTKAACLLCTNTFTMTNTFTGASVFSGPISFSTMTPGSILFVGVSSGITQDNANLFWNDTNNYLGIGNGDPQTNLDVTGAIRASGNIYTTGGNFSLPYDGVLAWETFPRIYGASDKTLNIQGFDETYAVTISSTGGNVSLNGKVAVGTTTVATDELHVMGADALATISAQPSGAFGESNLVLRNTDAGGAVNQEAFLKLYSSGYVDLKSPAFTSFLTGGTSERMRITATGDVLVGTTTAPGSLLAVNGTIESLTGGFKFPDDTTQTTAASVFGTYTSSASVSVTNTVTTTTLLGAGLGSLTLPANFWTVGKTLHVHIAGYITNDNAAPGTINFLLKNGSVTISSTTVFDMSGAGWYMVDNNWSADFYVTCRSTGGSGSVVTTGRVEFPLILNPLLGAGSSAILGILSTSPVTIDTTASAALDFQAHWGTADSDNSITQITATVETITP